MTLLPIKIQALGLQIYIFVVWAETNNTPTLLVPCELVCTPDSQREGPSLLLVLKWGGELTPAGRVQAEELGRAFRCMYPGGQGSLPAHNTHTHIISHSLHTTAL